MYHHQHSKHHRHFHIQRFSWFSFLAIGLLLVQLVYNYQITSDVRVLAYATNVNRQDLTELTNQERGAHGLKSLAINAQLNQAAQSKAEHMIAHNYWAHVAPDGTTPWYFFDQAGYNYINAGENLAYGFLSSSSAVRGWMDSPGHRANILGDYRDVGFGIANGSNYQGGENTVIVAMYGTHHPSATPAAQPVAEAPAQPAPPTPTPAPVESSTPEPAPTAPAAPMEPVPTQKTQPPTPVKQTASPAPALNAAEEKQRSTFVASLLSGGTTWPTLTSAGIILIAAAGFITTHIRLIRHGWKMGCKYVIAHPLTDAAAVGSIALLFLSATSGYIH